jgi:hypothetical protein
VNFLRDSNPRWSPLQLTEASVGKEMICQMLFNNNIVHESLKVIQMNNTSCQEPLVGGNHSFTLKKTGILRIESY